MRLLRQGWQGVRGPLALGHCSRRKAPLREAVAGEEEPSEALGVLPLYCDVLQALVAPHTLWGRVPGMQKQAGGVSAERGPVRSSSFVDSWDLTPGSRRPWGRP